MVWNERAGCAIDVPRLPLDAFEAIYAVDGGSTDGTVEYLRAQGIPVYKQPTRSLNAAYHYAVELCGSDALVVYFPKGTISPDTARRLADRLDERTDLVIASRNMAGARNEEDGGFLKPRKWGVVALARFAALLWRREGVMLRDVLHGVKAFKVTAFRQMNVSPIGVTVDLEMVVRSYRHRIPRAEVPAVEERRTVGVSHFPILRTGLKLAAFLVREIWSSATRSRTP